MVGRFFQRIALVLSCIGLGAQAAPAATAPSPPVIPPPVLHSARSYVLMDFRTGQVLAQKAPDLRLPPASLTKLMTAYLAYEALARGRLHWQQRIPVSVAAWHTGGSSMFIQPALPVTVDQLMHGLIIDSGNDAAVALAQAISGNRRAFIQRMNHTAAALGLRHTHYTDVDGLPHPDLYTSALDVARLSRDLIRRFPQVLKISDEKYYRYAHITQRSWNPALFGHPSVDGLKTGHTRAAGYCMDVTAIRRGRRLIAVVMGAPDWAAGVRDSLALLHYGFRFTHDVTLGHKGQVVGVYHDSQLQPATIPLTLRHSWVVTLPRGAHPQLALHLAPPASMAHGVRKGAALGQMRAMLGGRILASAPVYAARAAAPAGFFLTWWRRLRQVL